MPSSEATIVATYSRRMQIRLSDKEIAGARIKGKRLKPVCGDKVIAEPIESESDWLITAIQPRANELSRPNMRGKVEVLAANIDLVIVVAAATPQPDWFIIDRYLCAAENMSADALVLFNKTDISSAPDEFTDYARIGYDSLTCSASDGANIAQIGEQIDQRTAIMVGQSGVGKSSIINALTGSTAQRTATVSAKTSEGRHTTVNSEMLDTPGGGRIIDSPGVRDFAPALTDGSQVLRGFREVESAGQECRFANCRHLREPHCAVKSGVESGSINPRRYESYRRLLALTDRLDIKN
ncbi:MAG: ribosome small subunit-dependent GTPase A [Woeseiaceae bacterium]